MAYTIQTKLERKGNGIKVENAIAFFRSLEKNKISSGIHKDEGQEFVKRAAHTEFGTPRFGDWGWGIVPPRPAIRMFLYPEMMDEVSKTFYEYINSEKKTKLISPSSSAQEVDEQVGYMCQYLQQTKMMDGGYSLEGNTTGLDPEHNGLPTIEFKGFDDPWISTSQTLAHVNFKVTKK